MTTRLRVRFRQIFRQDISGIISNWWLIMDNWQFRMDYLLRLKFAVRREAAKISVNSLASFFNGSQMFSGSKCSSCANSIQKWQQRSFLIVQYTLLDNWQLLKCLHESTDFLNVYLKYIPVIQLQTLSSRVQIFSFDFSNLLYSWMMDNFTFRLENLKLSLLPLEIINCPLSIINCPLSIPHRFYRL